jgi:hypothetical protein
VYYRLLQMPYGIHSIHTVALVERLCAMQVGVGEGQNSQAKKL